MALAKKLCTIDDWLNVPENQKSDLINGEIVFQASPTLQHSRIQKNISIALASFGIKGAKGDDGEFLSYWDIIPEAGVKYEAFNVFTHDIAGWKIKKNQASLVETPTEIVPDWVCEVLSSNRRTDTIHKLRILQRNQVPYYWIVDPVEKSITIYKNSGENYLVLSIITIEDTKTTLPPFENLTVDIEFLFNIPN